MKRGGTLWIFLALAALACVETALHWMLGRGEFPTLLAIYLYRGYSGKAFYAGIVDNQIPAAIAGVVTGWVGYSRWPARTLVLAALGDAAFVAALVPLYRILIGPGNFAIVWGSPTGASSLIASHVYDVFTALIAAGAFTYGSYLFRRDWRRRKA